RNSASNTRRMARGRSARIRPDRCAAPSGRCPTCAGCESEPGTRAGRRNLPGCAGGGVELGAVRPEADRVCMILREMTHADVAPIHRALVECGAFSEEEVRVALEMIEAGLRGDYSLPAIDIDGV